MGKKKMKFTSFFKHREATSSWPWPSCKQPRTESFRMTFKTVNSVYLDVVTTSESSESWFTKSSESGSFSTASDESGGEPVETVIRGLQSDRFFFEPGDTRSILKEEKMSRIPFKESVVLEMESEDPYVDFRVSMEQMVEANGLRDWECLEELLVWYLRVNEKKTHEFIVGAFVDLLVGLLSSSSSFDELSKEGNDEFKL